ncbi:hypothetical protein E2C01_066412 [Portunus trituberculatus]|uniref:Uncharacterized protein n=1 Tax=Portunus trituberculatus TaxID=210409 RepID=A0A5B7HTS8_PORTR|nr:hypothetical protein [Portunus trituberculatus]
MNNNAAASHYGRLVLPSSQSLHSGREEERSPRQAGLRPPHLRGNFRFIFLNNFQTAPTRCDRWAKCFWSMCGVQ